MNCYSMMALSAVAGASAQYVLSNYLLPNKSRVYTWIFAFRNHKQLGEPCKTDLVIDRDGYSLGYSYEKKSALWVSYIISKNSIGINVERCDKFYPDFEVPEEYRVSPEDYRNTGYDKGHLAPNSAIDFSRKSNDQTFAMSNITLQEPKLNRQAWKSLESSIEGWTRSKGKLYIVTGPIYTKRPEKVNGLPLPKSFYKVIYSFEHRRCIGFIFPNKEVTANDLWKYAMSVADVEKETGYHFLNKVNEHKIKNQLEIDWWRTH